MELNAALAPKSPGFFVAPFAVDGETGKLGYWEISKLSPKWLAICEELLDHYGDSFDEAWSGKLSHIETQFTSGSGAALLSFRVRGTPVSSAALLSGRSPEADSHVLTMFVDFLRGVGIVRAAATSDMPFQNMFGISDRPVMIVVPWGHTSVSEQDQDVVSELEAHTAGAFFHREGVA
jgi:hypothetical protein